jgi:flagellar motor switch protein FliG
LIVAELDPSRLDRLVDELDRSTLGSLTNAIANLGSVEPEERRAAAATFRSQIGGLESLADAANWRDALVRRFGRRGAESLCESTIEKPGSTIGVNALGRHYLNVGERLKGEHPQLLAAIIRFVDSASAARILQSLPDSVRADAFARAALIDRAAYVDQLSVERVLTELCEASVGADLGGRLLDERTGVRRLVETLRRLESEVEQVLLEELEARESAVAERLRERLFGFDDLSDLDPKQMRELLKSADYRTVTTALSGAGETVVERFLSALSKRAAQSLREDIESVDADDRVAIEAARRSLADSARRIGIDRTRSSST